VKRLTIFSIVPRKQRQQWTRWDFKFSRRRERKWLSSVKLRHADWCVLIRSWEELIASVCQYLPYYTEKTAFFINNGRFGRAFYLRHVEALTTEDWLTFIGSALTTWQTMPTAQLAGQLDFHHSSERKTYLQVMKCYKFHGVLTDAFFAAKPAWRLCDGRMASQPVHGACELEILKHDTCTRWKRHETWVTRLLIIQARRLWRITKRNKEDRIKKSEKHEKNEKKHVTAVESK
jgi:hypothetical protein